MEHTLTFGCQHARGSSAEADFLSATAERRVLPIVLVIDSIASLAHFTSSQSLGSSAVASNRQLGNRPALRACLPRSVGQLLSVISSVSYQLSVISYQLSVISYQLSVISYQLSVISLCVLCGSFVLV